MEFKHHVMNVVEHQLYRGRIAITVKKVVDCEQPPFLLRSVEFEDGVSAFGNENALKKKIRDCSQSKKVEGCSLKRT